MNTKMNFSKLNPMLKKLFTEFESTKATYYLRAAKTETYRTPKRYYTVPSGVPGTGAGKGGGAGGSVRESGGGLGKYGAAQEEGYFHTKQREQLEKIKKNLKDKPTDAAQKEEK